MHGARAIEDGDGRGHLADHGPQERLDLLLHFRIGAIRRETLDEPRRLHERVVGDVGHRRVPRAAVHAHVERRRQLLGGGADVVDAVAEVEPVAGALVDGVVAAHRIRVLLAQPLQAEAVADLLVGGRGEDQVAGGPEALAGERGDRDGVRRDLALHVQGAPAPDLVGAHLAREGRHRPLARIGEDDVGVGEQEQRRPVAGAPDPGDEARPLGHAGVELALDAARLEVLPQELRGSRLVPRRVRRVDLDEPAEKVRHLAAQAGHRHARSILAA